MADYNPNLPEAYQNILDDGGGHVRAFGAGVIDPMGIPSWAANRLGGLFPRHSPIAPEKLDWYQRRMQEMRDESPVAAGVGSSVLPALLGLGIPRALGELTTREAIQGLPHLLTLGGFGGSLRDAVAPPRTPHRAQGAYPPGGF